MTTASIDKEWQRFTPNERVARFAVYLSLSVCDCLVLANR